MTTQTQERGSEQSHRDDSGDTALSNQISVAAGLSIGSILILRGVKRRSVRGVVMALAGTGLIARAVRTRSNPEQQAASQQRRSESTGELAVRRSVTIGRSPDDLYEQWRDPEVFSRIVGRIADVISTGEDEYRWTVTGPGGTELSWKTRVVESEPGELIRWETPEDASIPNSGAVRFREAPGDRGTVMTLSLQFSPPGGSVGASILNRLNIVPETAAGYMLDRFKSLVESGEIPTSEANTSGRGRGDTRSKS